jgi:hypothetical protein
VNGKCQICFPPKKAKGEIMSNLLYDHVAKLDDDQRHQIILNFEEFEREGKIGDCLMRKEAIRYMDERGVSEYSIVYWMNQLVNACYRYFYYANQQGYSADSNPQG